MTECDNSIKEYLAFNTQKIPEPIFFKQGNCDIIKTEKGNFGAVYVPPFQHLYIPNYGQMTSTRFPNQTGTFTKKNG
jgi:hypothetical protein